MSKTNSFWKREIAKENYWMIHQLSTTSFSLAGFAFTSLSFFLGLFSSKPEQASDIISVLLTCTVLFLLTGEMAREAYKISKYILAETIYLFTLSLLSAAFWFFVRDRLSFINPWATAVLALTVVYLVYRAIHNIYVAFRVR